MSRTIDKIAVILIDIQNAFISGQWSRHFGHEVSQIEASYTRCSEVLQRLPNNLPVLLTQTPFYTGRDRDFHESIKSIVINRMYPFVYKDSTNIMYSDGITEWMTKTLNKGVQTFIIGGCTITSCVRVSSTNLRLHYDDPNVEFLVDLSLCGARDSNYIKRCRFCMSQYMMNRDVLCGQCEKSGDQLQSPVDLSISSMKKGGVQVVDMFDWESILG